MNPATDHCDTCALWVVEEQASVGRGRCHGAAPTADARGQAVWPVTYSFDFCGDHAGSETLKRTVDGRVVER